MYEWHDHGQGGKLSVKINLNQQKAKYYRGEQQVGWSYVCTGKDGHETPVGKFRVLEKCEIKHSNRYGWIADAFGNVTNADAQPSSKVEDGETYFPSPMHQWMRLTYTGVGMHAGDIPEPGKALSHGCVRVPRTFAPILFEAVEVGTPVLIQRPDEAKKRKSADIPT